MADRTQKERTLEERKYLIEYALMAAHDMGFDLKERALLLGYDGDPGQNPEFLYREIVALKKGSNVEKRCEAIARLNALLEKVGHATPPTKQRYLTTQRYECLNGNTFHDWLKAGNLDQMTYAAEQLMYMST